ncbi:MAG: mannose-1-phosphate guanylyltransferase [Nostocoides sp.]
MPVEGFWAVVPAGGAGTRLWPVSRAGSPKFLHDLTGTGSTLLRATVDRLTPLAGEQVMVVTGAAHVDAVRAQVGFLPEGAVIAEPSPRDSMAAIALAAAFIERRDPEAVIGSFAADHVIPDGDAFRAVVVEAIEVATSGYLTTIGIEPTGPATGFGYVHMGPPLEGFPTARHVRQFVEKPDAQRAAAYLSTGEFRWNAGMFVVRATTLLDLLAEHHPDLARGVRDIAQDPQRLGAIWPTLTKIAIDHAVAEPAADAGRVVVVPGPFRWDDVGDFASLAQILPSDGPLTVVGDDADVLAVDASGLAMPHPGRLMALVGVDDIIVVDTPDAVLVVAKDRAQDVKAVVDALKERGATDLT